MVDLVDFVLARIAEREALALAASEDDVQWADGWSGRLRWSMPGDVADDNLYDLYLTMPPELVLAECDAKRRIVEAHAPDRNPRDRWHGDDVRCTACGGYTLVAGYGERGYRTAWPCPTLRLLALPHADHPDYRQEWAP